LDRPLVKELIQKDFNAANLKRHLQQLLTDENQKAFLKQGYTELKEKIGRGGASQKTALMILERMGETS
jgi:lipid A disaccharide synthetase